MQLYEKELASRKASNFYDVVIHVVGCSGKRYHGKHILQQGLSLDATSPTQKCGYKV